MFSVACDKSRYTTYVSVLLLPWNENDIVRHMAYYVVFLPSQRAALMSHGSILFLSGEGEDVKWERGRVEKEKRRGSNRENPRGTEL